MRYPIRTILTTGLLLLNPSQVQAPTQMLTLTVADIDGLRHPPRDSVLARIQSQLHFDQVMRRDHTRKALIAYARLNALRQELAILQKQRTNLSRIYRLYLVKQKHAEASDEEVLRAEHDLLNKEMAIVGHIYQLQQSILDLITIANIPLDLTPPKGDTDEKKVTAKSTHAKPKRAAIQPHQRPQRQGHMEPRAQRRTARKRNYKSEAVERRLGERPDSLHRQRQ